MKIKESLKQLHLPHLSPFLLLFGILIGVFITAQWKARPSRITNPLLPYSDLRNAQSILQEENTNLNKQISSLRKQIDENQKLLKQSKTVSSTSIEELESLKDKIALVPKSGEGVSVNLADSTTISTYDSIIHAADLRDLINFLWENGATAIAINNKRVSAFTSIDCIVNTILINNARFTPPFLIQAIGDQRKLKGTLDNPSFLWDLKNRRKYGLKFEVESQSRIALPAFDGSYSILFSKVK